MISQTTVGGDLVTVMTRAEAVNLMEFVEDQLQHEPEPGGQAAAAASMARAVATEYGYHVPEADRVAVKVADQRRRAAARMAAEAAEHGPQGGAE